MEKNNGKFVLKWDTLSKQTSHGLCVFLEKRYLVDVVISCGIQTMHAHKCVLAIHSNYLKNQFEKKTVEQILFSGVDFSIIKSVIEFIYSGETLVTELNMKYFIAVVKLLEMSSLEAIFEQEEFKRFSDDNITIPLPQLISKPPKYPTLYKPLNVTPITTKANHNPTNTIILNPYNKLKNKNFTTEAERACAKEAQASLITLSNLRKVIANTTQVHQFIVDDVDNTNQSNNQQTNFLSNTVTNLVELPSTNTETLNIVPIAISNCNENLTTDKIKHMLNNENVEIMFQTSDGNIIDVRNEDDLINLAKGDLTYRTIDETGNVGEVRDLKLTNNDQEHQQNRDDKENINPENITNLDNIYASSGGFNIQNSTMFEPQNLSMQSVLIHDSAFQYNESEILLADLTNRKTEDKLNNNEPARKLRNITPDMFFADLPSDNCTTNVDQSVVNK